MQNHNSANAIAVSAVETHLKARGMSGRALARQLGWSPSYIRRRLSGDTPLSLDDLSALAGALGIPAADLYAEPSTFTVSEVSA